MSDEKIPASAPVTVLPADDPNAPKIGWTVHEYLGSRIFKQDALGTPLTNADDIKEGDEIAVPALTRGYYVMTVKKGAAGELYADGDRLMAVLSFNEDDRHAWTCSGVINKRCLSKLSILSTEEAK